MRFFFLVLGIEPRAHTPTTELYPSPVTSTPSYSVSPAVLVSMVASTCQFDVQKSLISEEMCLSEFLQPWPFSSVAQVVSVICSSM
jgi:hypothetical protein